MCRIQNQESIQRPNPKPNLAWGWSRLWSGHKMRLYLTVANGPIHHVFLWIRPLCCPFRKNPLIGHHRRLSYCLCLLGVSVSVSMHPFCLSIKGSVSAAITRFSVTNNICVLQSTKVSHSCAVSVGGECYIFMRP